MKKFLLALLLIFCCSFEVEAAAKKFEYKIVPLGSLTSLQKTKEAVAKTAKVEELLNQHGQDGWEISEILRSGQRLTRMCFS